MDLKKFPTHFICVINVFLEPEDLGSAFIVAFFFSFIKTLKHKYNFKVVY